MDAGPDVTCDTGADHVTNMMMGADVSLMLTDIESQPEALARTYAELAPAAREIRALMSDDHREHVIIMGRGTSGHIADYLHYLLGQRNHILSNRLPLSLAYLDDVNVDLSRSTVIAISQSGSTSEVLRAMEWARRHKARRVAITNVPNSPVTEIADYSLVTAAGAEVAIPATKSFTTGLLASAIISDALHDTQTPLGSIAQDAASALRIAAQRPHMSADPGSVIVIGRGIGLATARETAIKLQECARVPALAFSAADFLHGPAALLHDRPTVILFETRSDSGHYASIRLTRERAHEAGCRVITIGSEVTESPDSVRITTEVPWLEPIAHTIVGQLFALDLARARNLDPDTPRGLTKVTHLDSTSAT